MWVENSNSFAFTELQMAHDMYGTLFNNAQHVIGATSQTVAPQGEESFLRDVVTPIYEVMQKVMIFLSILLSV